MWPADTDDLPQVTTVMCIETAKLCFRQAPSAHVVMARRMLSRAVAAEEG